jgi:hypothetical protein
MLSSLRTARGAITGAIFIGRFRCPAAYRCWAQTRTEFLHMNHAVLKQAQSLHTAQLTRDEGEWQQPDSAQTSPVHFESAALL